MTHLQFIFILFLISGCSGTNNVLAKPIAKNNESKPKIEENKQTNTLKADSSVAPFALVLCPTLT